MENFKKWVALLKENDLLCDKYCEKVDNARSKLELIRCCLDANGANFLQEMQAAGFALPYEVVCNVFRSYINGRYVAEFRNEKGNGYTSKMYCKHQEPILVDTTLCSILGCKCDVVIKKNNFAQLYVDSESEIRIILEEGAQVLVDIWKGAQVSTNDEKRTKVTIH